MLTTLKTEDWENIPPLAFYMTPLSLALDDVIKCLLEMRKDGVLRCKYFLEENKTLQNFVITLIHKDVDVQWLAGTVLKRDQFKFLYNVQQIVFNSALKDDYLKGQLGGVIFTEVIPMLTVFRAMLNIRDINDRKKADKDKEKEKSDRRQHLGIPEPEPEEEKLDIPLTEAQKKQLKRGKKIEYDPEIVEEYRAKRAFEKEMATYGVSYH